MSHDETNPKLTALQSFLPLIILLGLDYFGATLNGSALLSQYSLAIFAAEILLLIVFTKGEICNGQRSRLIKANHYLGLFWIVWLIIALLQGSLSSVMLSLLGLVVVALMAWRHYLSLATGLSLLGSVLYLYMVSQQQEMALRWLCYNPISQLLIGVMLANMLLLISRNRLQGFIALLPFAMAILLALNAFYVLSILAFFPETIPVVPDMPAELPILVYFLLHIMMMAIIGFHILRKIKLDYFNLILLFFMATSLPIWLGFLVQPL